MFSFTVVGAGSVPRPARAINTAHIVKSAASLSCFDWQLVDICIWLTCFGPFCVVKTSIEVRHYLPDLVVSAYHDPGENPWPLAASYTPSFLAPFLQGGNATERMPGKIHNNLRFKCADAVGHPGGAISALASKFPYFCDSPAVPFKPYFLSFFNEVGYVFLSLCACGLFS